MDGDRKYLSLLDERHNTFHESESGIARLKDELTFFESFIPEFFSNTGEGNDIRNMYEGIRLALEGEEKTIQSIDVNKGSHIYTEYLEGMKNFIHDMNNIDIVTEAEQLTLFEDKMNRAKENDATFIGSLYGGNMNESTVMPLSEAVSNVEFLIDFIPEIGSMKRECESLQSAITESTDETKQKMLSESLNMLYESVDNYCYSTLRNIVSTYYDINETLHQPPTTEKVTQTFQIW